MPDTHYAKLRQRSTVLPTACAMISGELGRGAEFHCVFREAGRSTPMMAADRSTLSFRAISFLVVSLGFGPGPSSNSGAFCERTCPESSGGIACQGRCVFATRILSSLQPGEAARIEQSLKAELQERGVRLTNSGAEITVLVTLSENYKNLVWTGEIHKGELLSQVVLIAADAPRKIGFLKGHARENRSEKFWGGARAGSGWGEISKSAPGNPGWYCFCPTVCGFMICKPARRAL